MNNQTLQTKHQTLTLDFCQNSYKSILAKQYDNQTRYISIRCTNCGQDFPLNQDLITEVKILTPDGRPILNPVPIQEDGTLLLELTESILSYPGKANAEIRIRTQGESKLLSTMTFQIIIEPGVYEDDRIIASEEFNALTSLIEKATEDYEYVIHAAQESADDASDSAKMSKSYAIGETNTRPDEDTDNAKYYSMQASASAASAETYMGNTQSYMNDTQLLKEAAARSAGAASQSESAAASSAVESLESAKAAQSYAIGGTGKRPDENISNAKYYYEQSKRISESLSGALRPMGTVAFAALPTLSTVTEGDMYNISDQFTTNASFKEGAGNVIPAGANVYKTSDGYWDVLAGTPVTGIKGNTENTYRRGNVNLTPENIGAVSENGSTMRKLNGNISQCAALITFISGWYRIARYAPQHANNAQGGTSNGCEIILKRSWGDVKGEYHHLELIWTSAGKAVFKSVSDISGYTGIEEIRLVTNIDEQATYLEIRCGNIGKNALNVIIENGSTYSVSGYSWEATTPGYVSYSLDSKHVLIATQTINSYSLGEATYDSSGFKIDETYLPKTGDSKENTVSFSNTDSTSPIAWTDVPVLQSGEKQSSIFNKISTMFKNIRYLYKMLGTADISKIEDGTVTGAISQLSKHKCGYLDAQLTNGAVQIYKSEIGLPDNANIVSILLTPMYNANDITIFSIYTAQIMNGEKYINIYGRYAHEPSTFPTRLHAYYYVKYY